MSVLNNGNTPISHYTPCPMCAAEYDGFVEGYAEGKGWECPRTWDIYDPRMNEIRDAFDDYQAIQTVAFYESASAEGEA